MHSYACSSLRNLDRSPSFRELVCARLRDKIGYQCHIADYRDTQKLMVQRTWDILEKLSLELSRRSHHVSHTLAILDDRARTAGRVIIGGLGDTMEATGHSIYDLLNATHDFTSEQHQAVAFYLVRDMRSIAAKLQSDIDDLDGLFQAVHLLEASSKDLPMRDTILTLIAGCHAIHHQLIGQ